MRTYIKWCLVIAIMLFITSLPLSAQKITYQKSSLVTKKNADKELKMSAKREGEKQDKLEKRSRKAEKRLQKKAKYKHRVKGGKLKREKSSERKEKRVRNKDRAQHSD